MKNLLNFENGRSLGFESALAERGLAGKCVLTSEIKPYAVEVLQQNHPGETVRGDVTQIPAKEIPDLEGFECRRNPLKSVLERGRPVSESPFAKLLLSHFPLEELPGKSIKDKRGGTDNIHSWDLEYKGPVSEEQKALLNSILRERRKKKWAEEFGIDWMDGMPLTEKQIRTFYRHPNLKGMLSDLAKKGYLKLEHPKKKVGLVRIQDETLPKGDNIVAGKMSFEIGKILDPGGIAPTLVAMDMQHLFVVDGRGVRPLTLREGLRLFGYPDTYKFNVSTENGYDLLGNTVVVPVIRSVAGRILDVFEKEKCG